MKRTIRWFASGLCVLALFAGGCESLQRKFTRKPKNPPPKPEPIIRFQDYSQAMTPLDRYRKHYLMFDYWNNDLIDAMQAGRINMKRIRQASGGAVAEMRTLQELLQGADAEAFAPAVRDREKLDLDMRRGVTPAQVDGFRQRIESQTRAMHRGFYWTKVKDRLRSVTGADAGAAEGSVPAQP